MDFQSRYQKLNDAQKKAVDIIDGPVMVIAGPGTGKTELLSMRVANILKQTDTMAESILCLTYTESGANAMRERLVQIIGKDAYKVAIHTFHSFGVEIINQNAKFFYNGSLFNAADELSSYEIINSIFNNLDYNNPIKTTRSDIYIYIQETLKVISELKRSGLTSSELLSIIDDNELIIDQIEPLLQEAYKTRVSKSSISALKSIINPIRAVKSGLTIPNITPFNQILADSLQSAVDEAITSNSTKAITKWKNTWLTNDSNKNKVLLSRQRQIKLRAVGFVYHQYLSKMEEYLLYDFDDMIINVVHTIEKYPELLSNLQEKYQYIMVDEFQDSNMAQMRILYNLTNNEIFEGKPNILVVGDDDQAIYGFQGAEIANIIHFKNNYPAREQITLVENYRSTASILDRARDIIIQGNGRLENSDDSIDKKLIAHNKETNNSVKLLELATQSDERNYLVDNIKSIIESGVSPSQIAVLARKHKEIIDLLPYFAKHNIDVNYERRDNVLDLEVITSLELLSNTIVKLFEQNHSHVNVLLPRLLSHPAFAIDPVSIWRLSLNAKNNHQSWMEVMSTTTDFIPLHKWLVTQAQNLAHTPLEQMLDIIIGAPNSSQNDEFVSPLYEYFFSKEQRELNPDKYLTYLEALRAIRTKLRNYKPLTKPDLQSFIKFIELHRIIDSPIMSLRPYSEKIDNAVNIMTAHKSKGKEFDHVYIVGAVDTMWGEHARSRSRTINYPENLPIQTSGGNMDDRLRLFFVAMTRAKKNLTISYHLADDNGKAMLRASFLTGDNWNAISPRIIHNIKSLESDAELRWYKPIVSINPTTMKELLQPSLKNYKLSATHLNNFLDVSRGGPEAFLINNILKFPQAKSPSANYGSAIHAALNQAHNHLLATGNHRAVEDVLHDFEQNLASQYLDPSDFDNYLQKGSDSLQAFLADKYTTFNNMQKSELNFAGQHAIVGQAHLTGSIDLVDINKKNIIVTDYKTGKPSHSWTGKSDYEKIKLHKYKQQLMFYKLLVENSRDYHGYVVESGVLQFIEPSYKGEVLSLESSFSSQELEEFSRLIQVVWSCIINLDLPDTSNYSDDYNGMMAFEKYLLDNKD